MDKIRVGCAVVAVKDEHILLGRRGKEPMYGKWVIPGGGIDLFEKYSETAVREIKEETGLTIRVGHVLHVAEIIVPQAEHRIVIYVSADITGGTPKASSDLLEVACFDRSQLAEMDAADEFTPTVREVLRRLNWLTPEDASRKSFKMPAVAGARRVGQSAVQRVGRGRRSSRGQASLGGIQLSLL